MRHGQFFTHAFPDQHMYLEVWHLHGSVETCGSERERERARRRGGRRSTRERVSGAAAGICTCLRLMHVLSPPSGACTSVYLTPSSSSSSLELEDSSSSSSSLELESVRRRVEFCCCCCSSSSSSTSSTSFSSSSTSPSSSCRCLRSRFDMLLRIEWRWNERQPK